MSIGERIRIQRKELGLTQEQLAERCSTRQADISRWERGETPQADRLPRLADSLGVSIRWLITGADAPLDATGS